MHVSHRLLGYECYWRRYGTFQVTRIEKIRWTLKISTKWFWLIYFPLSTSLLYRFRSYFRHDKLEEKGSRRSVIVWSSSSSLQSGSRGQRKYIKIQLFHSIWFNFAISFECLLKFLSTFYHATKKSKLLSSIVMSQTLRHWITLMCPYYDYFVL